MLDGFGAAEASEFRSSNAAVLSKVGFPSPSILDAVLDAVAELERTF
jgi:hypothetical protein